jgi:hypothetical protein
MRRRRNEEGNLFKAKAMNEVLCSVAQRRKRAMLRGRRRTRRMCGGGGVLCLSIP